jgi:uroporphyrin-3 C-methyltransferase
MNDETNAKDEKGEPVSPAPDEARADQSEESGQTASDGPMNGGADASQEPGRGSSRALIIWALLLTCAIAAAGVGAFHWNKYIYRADLSNLDAQMDRLEKLQRDMKQQVDTASAETGAVQNAQNDVSAAIDSLHQKQAGLEKSLRALYSRDVQTSIDWILAEAEYLVLAANQRLVLEGDVETATAALRSADERLRAADHPDLIPIREQLIKDIAALDAVNVPDAEGLAIYFAEATARVGDLPTKPIADLGTPFSSVKNEEYTAENWRILLSAVWSDLIDLVEVKDAELPDSVLFDPEMRYFLQQNMRLELASARLAVLRRDTANLRASTSLLKRLLTTYYDVEDAAVSTIVQRLDAAGTVELAPELPDIAGSLDMIRGYRGGRAHAGSPSPLAARSVP